MVQSCVVSGCDSTWCPNGDIKFHAFPQNDTRRKLWLSIVPLKMKFYKSARICNLHFQETDYDLKTRRLKSTAVPTILLNQQIISPVKTSSTLHEESMVPTAALAVPSTSSTIYKSNSPHKEMGVKCAGCNVEDHISKIQCREVLGNISNLDKVTTASTLHEESMVPTAALAVPSTSSTIYKSNSPHKEMGVKRAGCNVEDHISKIQCREVLGNISNLDKTASTLHEESMVQTAALAVPSTSSTIYKNNSPHKETGVKHAGCKFEDHISKTQCQGVVQTFRHSIQPSINANCVENGFETSHIFDFNKPKSLFLPRDEPDYQEDVENVFQNLDAFHTSPYQENILYYITGYIVKQIFTRVSCEHCYNALVTLKNPPTDHSYSLIINKFNSFTSFVNRGKLYFPSVAAYKIVKYCDKIFQRAKLMGQLGENNIENKLINVVSQYFTPLLQEMFNHPITDSIQCNDLHETKIVKQLAYSFFLMRIRAHLKSHKENIFRDLRGKRQKLHRTIIFSHL
ncbi:uncharacterized protein [Epargyreus clarus]|uniref:uncharacterized protein isoform X3 n=1 Tax=Epargyreus clarus TaxID=520877 RepID=UPI003C30B0FA